MTRKKELAQKAYWTLVISALRDRRNPKHQQAAERFLLRFAPSARHVQ
ncbi:hypothetical protein RIE95_05440 [Acidithiobacillus thiooxidans]|nr:hypothetical protein [Acidithiobacillus thiooxidans]MDR7926438.1 hypothetical protein [Acidithiobacillus thiooxidans]